MAGLYTINVLRLRLSGNVAACTIRMFLVPLQTSRVAARAMSWLRCLS